MGNSFRPGPPTGFTEILHLEGNFHTRFSHGDGYLSRHRPLLIQTRYKPMKTLPYLSLLALAAGMTASAQPPPPRGGDRRPPPPAQVPPLLALFDTDHDQVLSAAEIQAAADALGKLDRNGDGKVTLEEMRTPPPRGNDDRRKKQEHPPQQKPPVPPLIAALDSDHNGTISAEELLNAPESLKALDKDGDGALSPEELRPMAPPPREEEAGAE